MIKENIENKENDELRKSKTYRFYMAGDLSGLKASIHYVENHMDLSKEETKNELNLLKLVLSDKIKLIEKYGNNKQELHKNSSINDIIEYTKQFNMKEQEDEELRLTEQYRCYNEKYSDEQLTSLIKTHMEVDKNSFTPLTGIRKKEENLKLRIMKLALSDKEKEKIGKTK